MIATAQKFLSCILLASSILTSCFIGQSALQKVGASGLYLSLQGSRIIKTSLSLWSRSLPDVAAVELFSYFSKATQTRIPALQNMASPLLFRICLCI